MKRITVSATKREIAANHGQLISRNRLHQSFGFDIGRSIKFALSLARPLGGRILEVGSGQGRFATALARRLHRLESMDMSMAELRRAWLNLAWHGLSGKVRLYLANAERLPWQDGYFDAVVSMNVFHHLRSPVKVVAEMIRVVRPGGKVVVSDFDRAGFRIMDRIHRSEGRRHPAGCVRMAAIAKRLRASGTIVRMFHGCHQDVVVAVKKPNTPIPWSGWSHQEEPSQEVKQEAGHARQEGRLRPFPAPDAQV